MNIIVLNGSPRLNGNTSAFCNAFKNGAESVGHNVTVYNVATMNINTCLACEYCHTKGNGNCLQQDDMQVIYPCLKNADMVVLASPVHYWSFSGKLQSVITRFYAPYKPTAKKYAMILSSGSEGVYDAPISQYKSIVEYFNATDEGIFTFYGDNQLTSENLDKISNFAKALK